MSISRQAIITEEEGKFLAYDESTHVASHGNTEQEALDNLKEALALYFEDMEVSERQILDGKVVSAKESIKKARKLKKLPKENCLIPKTEKEIYEELSLSREQANSGKITKAHKLSSQIREKYGL